MQKLVVFAASGGRGVPVFAGETDCTYYFDWDTAFACIKEKEDLLCQVRDDTKHYDLSALTRNLGEFKCQYWPLKKLFGVDIFPQYCVCSSVC